MLGALIRTLFRTRAAMPQGERLTERASALPPLRERKLQSVRTDYCRKLHRLRDGQPVAHACVCLPVDALRAELAGDVLGAARILAEVAAGGPLLEHGGVWKLRRR